MFLKSLIITMGIANCIACTPLLTTDFDSVPEGNIFEDIVDLPGSPNGDRLLVKNGIQISDTDGTGDHVMRIFRNVILNGGSHGEVYFDPVAANDDDSIYFSWNGILSNTPSSGADVPVIAIKLKDQPNPDQPNIFSKLTVRYGPEKISVQDSSGKEISIGDGVTGHHNITLRVDPKHNTFAIDIRGNGVTPNGGLLYNGTLPSDTVIDPDNIGVTFTYAGEINSGNSTYIVNKVVISEWEP